MTITVREYLFGSYPGRDIEHFRDTIETIHPEQVTPQGNRED